MKITKAQLKQIIKEELAPGLSHTDEHLRESLNYLIDNLGSRDNVVEALRLVAKESPEFMARFEAAHNYLMS
jgi:hypothetical protein